MRISDWSSDVCSSDLFAILVFYLLVNALAVEVLPSPTSLQLPKSIVKEEPKQTPVIVVSKNDILVDNVRVMSTAAASTIDGNFLPDLKAELLRAPLMRVDGADVTPVTRGDANRSEERRDGKEWGSKGSTR